MRHLAIRMTAIILSVGLSAAAQADLTLHQKVQSGLAYRQGGFTELFRIMLPLAEQGDREAQSNIGAMYAQGMGVAQDSQQALYWLHKAAEQGEASAQYHLGGMYLVGKGGIPQDLRLGATWIRKSAQQGLSDAQYNLGRMYRQGVGVNRDLRQAEIWLRKAAEQGHKDATQALQELQ